MKTLKNIGLWILVVFFALLAIAYIPSLSCVFALLTVALTIPITNWQRFLGKYIKGKLKVIITIILVCLTIFTAPSVETDDSPTTDSATLSTAPTSTPTTTPTTAPTTTPTTAPTTPPTTEPPTEPSTTTPTKAPTTTPTTETTTKPAHSHKFKDATCTSPQTCSCGETKGNANGHSWKAATCKAPKTCTECGTTSGKKASHKYIDGKCTYCGKASATTTPTKKPTTPTASGDPDGDDASGKTVYRTPTGSKYHLDPDCGGKNSTKTTLSKAKKAGLTACKKCAK